MKSTETLASALQLRDVVTIEGRRMIVVRKPFGSGHVRDGVLIDEEVTLTLRRKVGALGALAVSAVSVDDPFELDPYDKCSDALEELVAAVEGLLPVKDYLAGKEWDDEIARLEAALIPARTVLYGKA